MNRFLFALIVCLAFLSASDARASCENDFARLDADFEGARMSECVAKRKHFEIRIDPENMPINPSPWYAFRVTPKQPGDLKIIMRYGEAAHRYRPKRSEDATRWKLIDPDRVSERRKGKKVTLHLEMEEEAFLIAAQELLLAGAYSKWTEEIAERASLDVVEIGASVEGRPIVAMTSAPGTARDNKEYVLFVGRQHPPELTGAFAMLTFLETVFSDTALANEFRARFHVIAVPLMNPDGVARGHWRHNVNGVDLNRDWGPFTQPETQAVKGLLDAIAEDANSELRLMLDFHSTNRNVFYVQPDEDETIPPNFVGTWLDGARGRMEAYEFERADRHQSDLATSKNYIYGRFGAPGITYEMGDQTDRRLIRASAVIFAEEMMKTLLRSDSRLNDKIVPILEGYSNTPQ